MKPYFKKYTQNNINQSNLFKDGDFRNHILNEKNIPITEKDVNRIFKKYNFDYSVKNISNFQIALTHISYLNKSVVKDKTAKILSKTEPISYDKKKYAMPLQLKDYDTFEYFGDAVVHLILTQYLYNRYEINDTGFLTKQRTKLERAENLSYLSKVIGLDKYVVIGRNKEYENARENDVHLTEDIFEAFMWALFLESSFETCKEFLIKLIEKEIDFSEFINRDDNYKEKIMQYFHKMKWTDPIYVENEMEKKNGENFFEQEFVVNLINVETKEIIGIGRGNTKIKAEQDSAFNALTNMNLLQEDDDTSDYYDEEKEEEKEEEKSNINEYEGWFKDNDFKNHILNEKNTLVTKHFLNNIFKRVEFKHRIKNIENYKMAMTHISYLDKTILKEKTALLLKDVPPISNEDKKNTIELRNLDYSRLSHLGNAMLRLALTEYLFERYPTKDQGFLTRLRIKIEKGETLSEISKYFELHKYAIIARNMEITNSRENDISLMKGIFESFIGSMSLETTYEDCKKFLIQIFEKLLDFGELLQQDDNYKEKLMQYFHKMKWKEVQYVELEIDETNPKTFCIQVIGNNNEILGVGTHEIKNKASQISAQMALKKLGVIIDDGNESDYY